MTKSLVHQLFHRLRSSVLARNAGWMFFGNGLRIIVQAAYFILIARSLGTTEYGAFVGAVSLIALLAPFAGLGAGFLLVKNVARDRRFFCEYWGNSLLLTALSGTFLLGLVMAVARFALPSSIPWSLILMVSAADLLFMKYTEIAAQAFQSIDRLDFTAAITLMPTLFRMLSAAIIFILWRHSSALRWGWFYLACAMLAAFIAVTFTSKRIGFPSLALSRVPSELAEGFYFGTSLSAQTVYNEIDKTMLARFSTLDATGIYAAAYRLIDVAFTPVRSVLYAAYTNFFRHGQSGIAISYSYAKKLLPKMMGYSLVIFLALFVTAPLVPIVLGHDFARSVEALRWLALLPFFKSIHYFLADSLTGAGYQRIRTLTQIGIAIFNVALNLWLIPAYSWRGAAWSSLASDGALALSMYVVVLLMMQKESRQRAVAHSVYDAVTQ